MRTCLEQFGGKEVEVSGVIKRTGNRLFNAANTEIAFNPNLKNEQRIWNPVTKMISIDDADFKDESDKTIMISEIVVEDVTLPGEHLWLCLDNSGYPDGTRINFKGIIRPYIKRNGEGDFGIRPTSAISLK